MATKTKNQTKATATATAAEQASALELVARDLTPAQLVERLATERNGETKTEEQVEHFRNMFEAAKVAKSNQRVSLARTAYLLASHVEVAGKTKAAKGDVNILGAAKVACPATEDEDTKEYGKRLNAFRGWLTTHVKAGQALHAKGYAFLTCDPTETDRAIVEGVHDETLRAQSAKGNAKTKAKTKAPATETETDEDGIEKSKMETVIPTAEGIIAALETVLSNIAKFKTEAGFDQKQADAIEDLLAQIATETVPTVK